MSRKSVRKESKGQLFFFVRADTKIESMIVSIIVQMITENRQMRVYSLICNRQKEEQEEEKCKMQKGK